MAKHLLLGATGPNWRLHVAENPDDLLRRIRHAFDTTDYTTARVVVGDRLEETTLTINPRSIGWWAIVDLGDPDS